MIEHGPGIASVTWVAALLPIGAVAVVAFSMALERRPRREAACERMAVSS